MTLSITARGTAVDTTAATTFAFSPASNFTAGQLAVLVLSYENSGTDGADPYTSVTDSEGNTWTRHQNALNDPGAANAGVVFGIFSTPQDGGQITTGTTITVTYSASVPGDAAVLWEVGSDTGVAEYVTGATTASYGSSVVLTTGTITVGDALICGFGKLSNAGATDDTDTTNGTWVTGQWAAAGWDKCNTKSQGKVQTTTDSTQTWNSGWSGNSLSALGWASFTEVAGPPPPTATPRTSVIVAM